MRMNSMAVVIVLAAALCAAMFFRSNKDVKSTASLTLSIVNPTNEQEVPPLPKAEPRSPRVAAMTDQDLIEEYEDAARSFVSIGHGLSSWTFQLALHPRHGEGAFNNGPAHDDRPASPEMSRFLESREEIVARGSSIVRPLSEFLEHHIEFKPGSYHDAHLYSLVDGTLELLTRIGGPVVIDPIMRVLENANGHRTPMSRRVAIKAMQHVTHVSFQTVRSDSGDARVAIQHPLAINVEFVQKPEDFESVSKLYREWLSGDGIDPSRWPEITNGLAQDRFENGNREAKKCAAQFLDLHATSQTTRDEFRRISNNFERMFRRE